MHIPTHKIEVIDLFCGIGGLSYGLKKAGVSVVAGLDSDPSCKYSYERNIKAPFFEENLRDFDFDSLLPRYSDKAVTILAGCAPCQPFSSHSFKKKKEPSEDNRYDLLDSFSRGISALQPDIVVMENVPGLARTAIFASFLERLQVEGYHISSQVVYCPDFGIPQKRRRLVMLASKLDEICMPRRKDIPREKLVSGRVLGQFPEIEAGCEDPLDSLHRAASLTDINLQRIRASRPGGTWEDWDSLLRPECYKRRSGASYAAMYGRIDPNDIAPTITTKFTNYGSGRFGHPSQDRALSLREGAAIQTFPRTFKFDTSLATSTIARQIGNAVPPMLATILGEHLLMHISDSLGSMVE